VQKTRKIRSGAEASRRFYCILVVNCDVIRTRGNKYKLVQHHCHYDLRKYNFTNRVVPITSRNSLSNHVVSADTVNTFKNRLDIFWSNQEVIFNYKADLAGTGNRSIIN